MFQLTLGRAILDSGLSSDEQLMVVGYNMEIKDSPALHKTTLHFYE